MARVVRRRDLSNIHVLVNVWILRINEEAVVGIIVRF